MSGKLTIQKTNTSGNIQIAQRKSGDVTLQRPDQSGNVVVAKPTQSGGMDLFVQKSGSVSVRKS
jgi:hypothetical protein